MPAKAVDECPEGKDLRPPSTNESLLAGQAINGGRVVQTRKNGLPCARLELFIPFAPRQKNLAHSPYVKIKSQRWEMVQRRYKPTRFFKNTVTSRVRPLRK